MLTITQVERNQPFIYQGREYKLYDYCTDGAWCYVLAHYMEPRNNHEASQYANWKMKRTEKVQTVN